MKQTIKSIYTEFKPTFHFLARLLLTYGVLSIIYSFWVKSYGNTADPITRAVAANVRWLLDIFYEAVTLAPRDGNPSMDVFINGQYSISVFEGCNGAALMYLFFAFLVGYWGGFKRLAIFTALGFFIIHVFNMGRLVLLAGLALTNSPLFHFTHKYLFTISIYIVVFILWIIWIRMIKPVPQPENDLPHGVS